MLGLPPGRKGRRNVVWMVQVRVSLVDSSKADVASVLDMLLVAEFRQEEV